MKVAIIISAEIDKSPFINYYTEILDRLSVPYDIYCWNKNNKISNTEYKPNVIVFSKENPDTNSYLKKIWNYWIFSLHIKKKLRESEYDIIIVHTIVNAIFLSNFLHKHYSKKYIFDIRDYSPIVPLSKFIIKRIINNSIFTSISSLGFKHFLPKDGNYIISHNTSSGHIDKGIKHENKDIFNKDNITILTIGQLRNYQSNLRLINDCGNKEGINIKFSGDGLSKVKLEKYSLNIYSNVSFTGKYIKEDEPKIVEDSDIMYILLPINRLEANLMSNRFYLSLIHRKPMIVNEESIQAYYVKKYNLGIVIKSEDNIYERIIEYKARYDNNKFNKGCEMLLSIIRKDISYFENKIQTTIRYQTI